MKRFLTSLLFLLTIISPAYSVDITDLTGITGKIGSEDVYWVDSTGVPTFSVSTYSGGTITLNKVPKVPWYDARSYTSISAAVTAIGATVGTLVVPNAQTLTANLIIPSTLNLYIPKGGSIAKASTYTVTINGPFEAGLYQVFTGFAKGDVTFGLNGQRINPEWWGAVGDATGITAIGTDSTSAINQAFASVNCKAEIVMSGLYRVVYPGTATATYPHSVGQIKSNTTVIGVSKGTGIFHDHIAAYGDTDVPYLLAIWGGVSNITIKGITFIGRSDHTYNGPTCGTFIGIRNRSHNGTAWSGDPASMADVPSDITIEDCKFTDGRGAVSLVGAYTLDTSVCTYTPIGVKIRNNFIQDVEHGIEIYKSNNFIEVTGTTLNVLTRIQRGVAVMYSTHGLIDKTGGYGPYAMSGDISLIGGVFTATSFPVYDWIISNLSADSNILRPQLIAVSNNDESNMVSEINISGVNARTSTINLSGFTTVTDGGKKINISNSHVGQIRAYRLDGLKINNITTSNVDLANVSNINLDSSEINGSLTTPFGVLATVNSQCFDLVGVTGLYINNSNLIVGDENGFAGLNFISGAFTDISLTNSRVRQYANLATTQRLINCADGLTVTGLKIIGNSLAINYVMATFGTFVTPIIKDNVCSLNALMHKYGDTFTGIIKDNYGIGAFTVATDGTWVLRSGIVHDLDGSVSKTIKLNDAGTAFDFF